MMEEYILITGASSGIGEATAIELSEEHRIILSGRNIEKLKEVQNKCHCPQKHLLWRCDLDKDRLQVYTSLNSLLTVGNKLHRIMVNSRASIGPPITVRPSNAFCKEVL